MQIMSPLGNYFSHWHQILTPFNCNLIVDDQVVKGHVNDCG